MPSRTQPAPPSNPTSAPSDAWHALPASEVVARLGSDAERGLASSAAAGALARWGPNLVETLGGTRWYAVLGRQFKDVLIAILAVAALISLAIGEPGDALVIAAILLFNGVLGFAQEWRAERALEALRGMLAPHCTVVRDGREQVVLASSLVPGDLVPLEAGDRVAADVRLLGTAELRADESSLTGESESVAKGVTPVAADAALADRTSMAWMGTAITHGRALGVVVATATRTEFGRIAELTERVEDETTPLGRRLAGLGKQLGVLALGVSALIAAAGWLAGRPPLEMFMTGVSLAVAVVPEGLPAVVTITLGLGVRAMVRRRALLRRLQAAETLGSATVICTDKTGTLTQNEMTVRRVWLPGGELETTGVGYDPAGHFEAGGRRIDHASRSDLLALLETGLRCTHARVERQAEGWRHLGEPTEAALVVAAYKAWLEPRTGAAVLVEFPFSSDRKRMTVVHETPAGRLAHVKGAAEVILARCSRVLDGERERELRAADRDSALAAHERLAGLGLRTLALARRTLAPDVPLEAEAVEGDLTLLGLVGILDPPRREVREAVGMARSAGIKVVMITGDAPRTALAIAQRIGLDAERAVTGPELEAMDEAALAEALRGRVLFARTTPEHKLRIVTCLQAQGHVAGMTGDGVNDAPALKKADIGIAMGVRGTDVAKGASDMVLTDDNFASIIGAVEEGRRQYDNIQKFVRYLLSSNTGEVFAVFVNVLLGGPLILLPVQILWMNMVTDGMTAVALGLEPAERGVMERPPVSSRAPILDRRGILVVLLLGGYIGAGTLWLFQHYLALDSPEQAATAQTMAFTGIVLLEKMNVFNFRTLRAPISKIGFFSNWWVLGAVIATVGLQAAAVYTPFLQAALHTVPLGWRDWALMLALAAPIFLVSELVKWLAWRRQGGSAPPRGAAAG